MKTAFQLLKTYNRMYNEAEIPASLKKELELTCEKIGVCIDYSSSSGDMNIKTKDITLFARFIQFGYKIASLRINDEYLTLSFESDVCEKVEKNIGNHELGFAPEFYLYCRNYSIWSARLSSVGKLKKDTELSIGMKILVKDPVTRMHVLCAIYILNGDCKELKELIKYWGIRIDAFESFREVHYF